MLKKARERWRWRKENYLPQGTVSFSSNIYDGREPSVVFELLRVGKFKKLYFDLERYTLHTSGKYLKSLK